MARQMYGNNTSKPLCGLSVRPVGDPVLNAERWATDQAKSNQGIYTLGRSIKIFIFYFRGLYKKIQAKGGPPMQRLIT